MSRPDEKILLVDDEPRLLAGLRRRLVDRFQILTAESAAEAIRILESDEKIGAILTDMRMPERDGLDLLIEVSERWPDIRRLMLTGNNDQDTAMAAVNRGRVFRFFRKPCDAEQLANAFSEAIEEYRFVTGALAARKTLELRARSGARSRRAFLSAMSHELLTPLNHILGFSSMLEMKLRDKEENEALEYLDHIKDSGETLLRLVQRVLEIVRYTSGDPGRELQITDAATLITEELNQLRTKADTKAISISFQNPPAPIHVRTSTYELRFSLRELLDNALKFTDAGGHVSVAASESRGQLLIRIADTGVGMNEDTVRRALGIFNQGEEGINRRFGGMGLGLTFVAFFARANRGKVTIESEKGSGTTVMMTLPTAEQSRELSRIA
ncbi:MAG: hybrid sensor histidine kinase/response regulator [Rhodomicrobiaceae bacterium]